MNNIKIVVDSSANLTDMGMVPFASAPLKIITDSKEYTDNNNLDVKEMADMLYHYHGKSSTSCPNINDWLTAFGDAEKIICITITSALSGTYNSACMAKQAYEELHPQRRVHVIDSRSTGPEMALMAYKAHEMIAEGADFDAVTEALAEYNTDLIFVLESMKNLANNGRVSKIAATAAGVLGVRAIGKASDEGTLELLSKSRGASRSTDAVVKHMTDCGYSGGKVRIAHCQNDKGAYELSLKIKRTFPSANKIIIEECRGLCSFYAEKGGILIGFEI